MSAYIVRRLLLLPVVLFGVTILIFIMLQFMSPYARLALYIPDPTQLKQGIEVLDRLVEEFGLNDPAIVQYGRWLNQLFHGNLGWAESARRPVADALLHFLPATVELAMYAAFPVVFIGIWLGKLSAVHKDKPLDHITRVVAITGWSFPTFVLGLFVLMIFYGLLGWFPPGRLSVNVSAIVHSANFTQYTGMNTIDAILNRNLTVLGDALRHLFLPVFTLSYLSWALIMRIMRSSMLETLRQDYITTARSKGLSERVVINKHAKRNALLPVTTIAGLMVAGLMSGLVITETVFDYRGLGRFAAQAAVALDIPGVLGFALFNGVLLVTTNLIVDILYAYFDPRVRLE